VVLWTICGFLLVAALIAIIYSGLARSGAGEQPEGLPGSSRDGGSSVAGGGGGSGNPSPTPTPCSCQTATIAPTDPLPSLP
jgi:hypothetical protein